MNFQQSIEQGTIKKVFKDILRSQNLFSASSKTLITALKTNFEPNAFQSIVRELYEALRQYCEALGYLHGYKFGTHEAITTFLEEMLYEKNIALSFDRYRKLRNGINYYGDDVAPETVKEALKEIPELITILSKHKRE